MSELSTTEIAVQLNDCHNEIGSLKHRMDKAEQVIEQIRELNTTTQLIAQRQNNIDEKLDNLSSTVKEIDNQPKEKWNKATWIVIAAFITAAVGLIISALTNFAH